jgi:hypothetical protein
MDGTCEILRLPVLSARGPSGGLDATYSVDATVACRVEKGYQPPFERAFAGGISAQIAARVVVPKDTDCVPADRVRIASGNNAGRIWEVIGVDALRNEEVHKVIWCQEIGR